MLRPNARSFTPKVREAHEANAVDCEMAPQLPQALKLPYAFLVAPAPA